MKERGFTKFLVVAHGELVNQFSKNLLVDGVIDIKNLVPTKTPIETGPIRCVGKNFNTNVTWRNVLKIAPKKFNRVPVSVPNNFVYEQNAVNGRAPKKIDVMTVVFLITWHQAFCDLYSKGLIQVEIL